MDGVRLAFYHAQDLVSYGRADNRYVRSPKAAVALSLGQAVLRLRQVVEEHEIDVVHAHWAIPMGFVGALVKRATRTPLVISTHGRDVYVNPEAGAIVPTLWYVRPFLKFALRQADGMIAVSRDCRHYAVEAGAPPERVTVISNGVDTARFSPREVDGTEIRSQLDVSPATRLILFVGSLTAYKGVDTLLRAMTNLVVAEPDAVAMIIGDGPEREALTALRDALGLRNRVIFLGSVPNSELATYENGCDVFVLPSRRESFGIAVVEAMACARPVIGTRVGGLREIIDDGETGILVEPDRPEELAIAILEVLRDRLYARHLGDNARRKVEVAFNWTEVGRRTVDLYREILERWHDD
jgi:glycosyltransferase involved in cell wall biosynthesis